MRGALLEVPHHDHVTVVFQHVHRVFDRLLVEVAGAGHLRIREAGDLPTQAQHCGLMRQPCAGAGLVERRDQDFVRQQIGVLPIAGERRQLISHLKNALKLVALETLERQNVPTGKAPHDGDLSL